MPRNEQTNSSKAISNIYLQSLGLAIRFDLRFAQYMITIQKKSDLALKVLLDTQKLIDRTLFVTPQMKFYCQFLTGLSNLRIFNERVIEFQSRYAPLKKYKQRLTAHIPYNSFALGEWLIELPNFSSELRTKLTGMLTSAKQNFENSVQIGRAECFLYELDFSVKDALLGLAQTNFYLGDLRQRVLEYKYAKYNEDDRKRKIKRI